MREWLHGLTGLDERSLWISEVFIVVCMVVTVNLLLRLLLARLARAAKQTENVMDDAVVSAAVPPIPLLSWVVGLTYAAEIAAEGEPSLLTELIEPTRYIGVIVMLTWFVVRLINEVEHNLVALYEAHTGRGMDHHTAEAIAKLLRVSVMITGVLVLLQTLGFSVSGVLAFGGVGGIAVGFAAKDLLANVFGGLTIYMDRPFSVGDWIRSPDRDIEGVVEKIGWRTSCIRRFDKRPLYVPNHVFTTIAVENPSRMTNRRLYETIGLRYDDAAQVDDIVRDVRRMLFEHPEIDNTQTLIVNFDRFGDSSLDFFVYAFTRTTQWVRFHEVKHELLMLIYGVIEQHGAEVAFPTRTLHVTGAEVSNDSIVG